MAFMSNLPLEIIYLLYKEVWLYKNGEIKAKKLMNTFSEVKKAYNDGPPCILGMKTWNIEKVDKHCKQHYIWFNENIDNFIETVLIFGKYVPEFDYNKLYYIPIHFRNKI